MIVVFSLNVKLVNYTYFHYFKLLGLRFDISCRFFSATSIKFISFAMLLSGRI